MTKQISRRTVLRGVGVSLALPYLDAMLPRRASAQEGSRVPPRMLVTHYGTGTNISAFHPEAEGKDHGFSRILRPLERFGDQMTVFSGLHLQHGGGHDADYTYLTGALGRRAANGIEGGVSADQVAAEVIGRDTRFPSLQLSINRGTGYGGQGLATLSWNRSGIPLAAENDPKAIFDRLFKVDNKHEAKTRDERLRRRGSILDAVLGEAKQMERRVGKNDKEKLDEYFTSVREIEAQVEREVSWSHRPKPTPELDDQGDYSRAFSPRSPGFDYAEWKNLMFDLIVMAFQTDSTRVVTFNIRAEGTGELWPVHNVTKGHHALTHATGPNDWDQLAQVDEVNMRVFWARFLDRLQSIKEADGRSLLDHSLLVWGSGASQSHSGKNLPIALFGGAARGVRHQGHLKLPDETPLARVWHTMLDRMAVPAGDQFQDSTGVIDDLVA